MVAKKTSLEGLAEIAGHEGIVLQPYKDSVGVWTLGIGHTAMDGIPPDPSKMDPTRSITVEEAFDIFAKSIVKYERRVNDAVKVPLTQNQFDALVSFDYNTGGIDRAQLTKALNEGNLALAAQRFMGWVKPPEIKGRRLKEQRLFRDGVYSNNGKASVIPTDGKGKPLYSRGVQMDVLGRLQGRTARQPDDPGPIPRPQPMSLWERMKAFFTQPRN